MKSADRPVPLEYAYSEIPLAQTLEKLVAEGKAPVYVVHFTQKDAADSAQDFTSLNLCTREEKNRVAAAIAGFRFTSPYGPDIRKWLQQGIGLHHAGLLPKYRVLVEQLAQRGLLKVICGTDTLGVGINVPIRTVLFTPALQVRRAEDRHPVRPRLPPDRRPRRPQGLRRRGFVVAQAPEHCHREQEARREGRAGGKKVVKRKPPEHNFANWDRPPSSGSWPRPRSGCSSRFEVSHGMLLNVLSRRGRRLPRHAARSSATATSPTARRTGALPPRLAALPRASSAAASSRSCRAPRTGARLRVNADLQDDFSMDQTLSLYLLETLPALDPDSETYALDVLTLVESILENPELILRRQLDKLKDRKVAEMKAEGIEYDQRMAELEKLEYPKPLRDFVYGTFNAFADRHPWVGEENIRPKSIAREMFEGFRSFSDYVQEYDLERAEGLLLRHLNSVYKVLAQTVPDGVKTDALREMELYLRDMLRQVDASLLEEWERMRDPNYRPLGTPGEELRPSRPEGPPDVTRDPKAFTSAIRTRAFAFLRAWSIGKDQEALDVLDQPEDGEGQPWTVERLRAAREAHRAEHGDLRLDPEARNVRHTSSRPSEDGQAWRVQQMLVDREGLNDWVLELEVDLPASREAGAPVLRLLRLGGLA